jgi:hypothetical protein
LLRAILGGELSVQYKKADFASFTFFSAPNLAAGKLLLEQLVELFAAERARAAETRRRSEQAFTRLLSVATLVAALTAWGFANADTGLMTAAAWTSAAATFVLAVALVAAMKNLGKEQWYAPISFNDFTKQGVKLRALQDQILLPEYMRAIAEGEQRNDDAIDRLHTAHALTFVGIFLLIAATLVVGVVRRPRPHETQAPRCDCACNCSAPATSSSVPTAGASAAPVAPAPQGPASVPSPPASGPPAPSTSMIAAPSDGATTRSRPVRPLGSGSPRDPKDGRAARSRDEPE